MTALAHHPLTHDSPPSPRPLLNSISHHHSCHQPRRRNSTQPKSLQMSSSLTIISTPNSYRSATPRASSFTRSKRLASGSALSANEALGLLDQPSLFPSPNSTPSLARFTLARIALTRALRHSTSLSSCTPPPPPSLQPPLLRKSPVTDTILQISTRPTYSSQNLLDQRTTQYSEPPVAPPFPPAWRRPKRPTLPPSPVHTTDVYPPWPSSTYLPRSSPSRSGLDPSDPAGSSEQSTSSDLLLSLDDLQSQGCPNSDHLPTTPSASESSHNFFPQSPNHTQFDSIRFPHTFHAGDLQASLANPRHSAITTTTTDFDRARCHTVLHDFPFSRPAENDSTELAMPSSMLQTPPCPEPTLYQLHPPQHPQRPVLPLGGESTESSTDTVVVHPDAPPTDDADPISTSTPERATFNATQVRPQKSRSSTQTKSRTGRLSLQQRFRDAGEKLISVIPRTSSLPKIRTSRRSRTPSRSPPRSTFINRRAPPSTAVPLVIPEPIISNTPIEDDAALCDAPIRHNPGRARARRYWGRRPNPLPDVDDDITPGDTDVDGELVTCSTSTNRNIRAYNLSITTPPVTPPSSPPPVTPPSNTDEDTNGNCENLPDKLPLLPPSVMPLPPPNVCKQEAPLNAIDQVTDSKQCDTSMPSPEKQLKKADTKNMVTIRRVVKRVLANGSVEVVTYNVQVKPERVLDNGDVVIKRKMRRAKDDGSGTELLTVMQVIPRARENSFVMDCGTASPSVNIKDNEDIKKTMDVTNVEPLTAGTTTDERNTNRTDTSQREGESEISADVDDKDMQKNRDDVSTNLSSDSDEDSSPPPGRTPNEAGPDPAKGSNLTKRDLLSESGDGQADDDDGASSLPDILERGSRLSDAIWGMDELGRRSSARSKTDLCTARVRTHARVIDAPIWEDRPLNGRARRTLPHNSNGEIKRWGISRSLWRREEKFTNPIAQSVAQNSTEPNKRHHTVPRMLSFQSIWRRTSSRECSPAPHRR